jgi:hypothetical protein
MSQFWTLAVFYWALTGRYAAGHAPKFVRRQAWLSKPVAAALVHYPIENSAAALAVNGTCRRYSPLR